MSLFRTLRICRALSAHCNARLVITRNIGALSALQTTKLGDVARLARQPGHIGLLPDRTQQYDKYLSTEPDPEAPSIDYNGLVALLESGDVQLIDVREPDELVDFGKIDKSYNIPLGDIEEALTMDPVQFREKYKAVMPKTSDTNIIFHCLAGIRSADALTAAHNLGFSKARHYPGGWEEWAEETGVPFKKC